MHGFGRLLLTNGIIFEGNFTEGFSESIGKLLY